MRTDDPRVVSHKILFEPGTDGLVEVEDVVGGDALAIRRVGDHDGRLLRLLKLIEVLLHDVHHLVHSSRASIVDCRGHGVAVDVVSIDFVVELPLLAVVVVDPLQEVFIEVFPAFESKLLPEHTRIDIEGDERRLHENGS